MEHASFVMKIDPAHYEEYVDRHRRVDPAIVAVFADVGIESYYIFFHEETLFAYMKVGNFHDVMRKISEHPTNANWQAFMTDLLQLWETVKPSKSFLKCMRLSTVTPILD